MAEKWGFKVRKGSSYGWHVGGGAKFLSCGGRLLNQSNWELIFPTIREDLKKFGGAMTSNALLNSTPISNRDVGSNHPSLPNV